MATERLPMRKIRDILRLKVEGRRHRHIARALKVGVGTVSEVVRRAATAGLDWARVEELGEAELEAAVYGEVSRKRRAPLPDPAWMDRELKRIGVTLQLLHVEYRESHPDGYGYTQFCEHYRRWKKSQRVVMRQVHRAGEKMLPKSVITIPKRPLITMAKSVITMPKSVITMDRYAHSIAHAREPRGRARRQGARRFDGQTEVRQDLLDDRPVLDGRQQTQPPAAVRARQNVKREHSAEQVRLRVGQGIDWPFPSGTRHLRVVGVEPAADV